MDSKLTSPLGVFGDPCVVANNTGDFYFLHLSDPEGMGWRTTLDRIVPTLQEGGRRGLGGAWATPPKDQDKEWAVSPDGTHPYVWTHSTYEARSQVTAPSCAVSDAKGRCGLTRAGQHKAGDCLTATTPPRGRSRGRRKVRSRGGPGSWIYFDKSLTGA